MHFRCSQIYYSVFLVYFYAKFLRNSWEYWKCGISIEDMSSMRLYWQMIMSTIHKKISPTFFFVFQFVEHMQGRSESVFDVKLQLLCRSVWKKSSWSDDYLRLELWNSKNQVVEEVAITTRQKISHVTSFSMEHPKISSPTWCRSWEWRSTKTA